MSEQSADQNQGSHDERAENGEASPKKASRLLSWSRRVRARVTAGTVLVLACVVGLLLPSAYVIESPGPTMNVLGSVDGNGGTGDAITITGAKTYKDSGKLLMTTVNASGLPSSPAMNWETLWAWVSPQRTVMPREVVYPSTQTGDQYEKQSEQQMQSAQSAAHTEALAFLKKKGVDVTKIKVTMNGGDVGGPSAGLMYTLGTIDKLTSADETGGKTIAGTGTMNSKGEVGAIGGIRLKMIASKRDGATWFLAPAANCDEVVGNVPAGLRDVKVRTLDEAYKALVAIGQGKGASLPHCTVKTTK
ncbi:MAG: Lon protease [Bifidobacteriaceae bacterium]|jgi:PDZ domain-containing protein|nr:Lon protease [Bifidobacteriaceae bacterium]